MTEKTYDHKGLHATADILLNSYPKDALFLFQESLKYCNLNIVAKKIHQFTKEAATGVYVLSESSADIHEYPEVGGGYICVSVFTCGKEGNPMGAIEHFISLLDVKDVRDKCFNRGHFGQKSISLIEHVQKRYDQEKASIMQDKIDQIAKALTTDQLESLSEVISWCGTN